MNRSNRHQSSTFQQKRDINGYFSRLAETDPYACEWVWMWMWIFFITCVWAQGRAKDKLSLSYPISWVAAYGAFCFYEFVTFLFFLFPTTSLLKTKANLNVSVWSGDKTSHLSWLCQISILAPYCRDGEPRYTPNASERLQFPWIPIRTPPDTTQTSPRHPPDSSREHNMPTDDNRRQQTPPDILKQHLSVSGGVWRGLFASVGVCWHVMFPGAIWGVSGGCLGGVWECSER